MKDDNKETRSILIKEGKYIIAIFLASVALFTWIATNFWDPLSEMKQDVVLIQSDINSIKNNHLKHIEGNQENIKENQKNITTLMGKIERLFGYWQINE